MLLENEIFQKSLKNSKKDQDFNRKKGKVGQYSLLNYNYEELIGRFLKVLEESTASNIKVQRLSLEPPKIGRDGTKKTLFLNFEKICQKLGREKEHLFFYISTELGTTASIQDSGALVLKGKFQPKGFENILRNYIKEYVLCGSCHSSNTILEKDAETRLIFLRCNRCQAWRSVNQIRPGFIAQTKKKKF
mmetsp:Transcript_21245/g.53479  ORF Transcript_21245/g.53479 Transcript_21245/m.53479 type:complete len:190 (+) Transcript_21245:858-1427(+)